MITQKEKQDVEQIWEKLDHPILRVSCPLAGDISSQPLMEWNIAPTATRTGLIQDSPAAPWCEVLHSCAWHNTHVAPDSAWWHLLIPIWHCIFLSILQGLARVSLQEPFAYVVSLLPLPIPLPLHGVCTWLLFE